MGELCAIVLLSDIDSIDLSELKFTLFGDMAMALPLDIVLPHFTLSYFSFLIFTSAGRALDGAAAGN